MLDITCESSAKQTIRMLCQALFPLKNYIEHALKMSSASHDRCFKDYLCCELFRQKYRK